MSVSSWTKILFLSRNVYSLPSFLHHQGIKEKSGGEEKKKHQGRQKDHIFYCHVDAFFLFYFHTLCLDDRVDHPDDDDDGDDDENAASVKEKEIEKMSCQEETE